jgi:CDP-glucose 4,6-dehydratase
MNINLFKNKKILITGCTGFTGGWMILYFKLLKAQIIGYSKKPPFSNSMFTKYNLKKKIRFIKGDVQNFHKLKKTFNKYKPDFIFHLAADSIVSKCYENPRNAYLNNSIGIANLLEVIRQCKINKKLSINIITTDKVYKNNNNKKLFKEQDDLGNDDAYSSSKTCGEYICSTYFNSYFTKKKISMNILRSGNIIGGGDWSEKRLIPDIIRSVKNKKILEIRNPNFIRPWQHIFDVINAYAKIALIQYKKNKNKINAWNIGPKNSNYLKVKDIVKIFFNKFYKETGKRIKIHFTKKNLYEKKYLFLNSSKLEIKLKIKNKFNINQTLKNTLDWYLKDIKKQADINFSYFQLRKYLDY